MFTVLLSLLLLAASDKVPAPVPLPSPQCQGLPNIDCPIINEGEQIRILGLKRMIMASYDTTTINDNAAALIDVGRVRAKRWLSDCQIEQNTQGAINWYKTQYGFDEVLGPFAPLGSYQLVNHFVNATTGEAYNETVNAYPYANVDTWKPDIVVDTAFPKRMLEDKNYWTDYGLIAFPSKPGVFKAGPNAGLRYGPGVYMWYDQFMIVRANYTDSQGKYVPHCIHEKFISRSVTYSNVINNIRNKTHNFIFSQLVDDQGNIGFYSDPLMKVNGEPGTWYGNGTLWELSRLTVTFPEYTRPSRYGRDDKYWPR